MFRFKLKDVTIECSKCHHKRIISSDNFEYDVDAVGERSMGTEFQHCWKLEEQECEKCHKFFSLSVDMWEYPIGCINYQEAQIDGALFVNKPEIEELGESNEGEN